MDIKFRINDEKKDAALREWEEKEQVRIKRFETFEKTGRIIFLAALAVAGLLVVCMFAGLLGEVYYGAMYLAPFMILIVPVGLWIPGRVLAPSARKKMDDERERLFLAKDETMEINNSYLIRIYRVQKRKRTDKYDLRLIRNLKRSGSGLFVSFMYEGPYDARMETDTGYEAVIPDYYEPPLYEAILSVSGKVDE